VTEIKGAKLQNSLGRMENFNRDDMSMNGILSLAKVIKVHHHSGTADIQMVNTNDRITSSPENKGRFAARIMARSSYFDEKTKRYWGSFDPIAEGSMVVVTFLDGMKKRPIILGAFHRPDNVENPNPEVYPLKERQAGFHRREALKQVQIFPNLTYFKMDGEGNIERTFGNKSFLAVYNTSGDPVNIVSDSHMSMDFEDLSENNKRTGETIEPDWDETKSPLKLLFVHQDKDNVGKTKFFIEDSGTFRITRDSMDGSNISYVELNNDGSITLRRQMDDPYFGQGEDYAHVKIGSSGEIVVTRNKLDEKVTLNMTEKELNTNLIGSEGKTDVKLTPNLIDFKTTGNINMKADGTVTIEGVTIDLNEG